MTSPSRRPGMYETWRDFGLAVLLIAAITVGAFAVAFGLGMVLL